MAIKKGDTVYILKRRNDFRPYQIEACLIGIERVAAYPRGWTNIYEAMAPDGQPVASYFNTVYTPRRRAIRKTPHPNVPLYRSRAGVDKGEKGINLICIKDDCPKDGDMVDARKCERCEYHNYRKDGVGEMNCTHPNAMSNPNDERWEALKSTAGMLHVTMISSAPDNCERCKSVNGVIRPATQTITIVYDNPRRPRRYCDECAEAGRKLGWIQ